MQKKNLILVGILVFFLSLVGIYALAQDPGHPASDVGPGEFDSAGDYIFPDGSMVGIGETNPTSELHIKRNGFARVRVQNSNSGNTNGLLLRDQGDSLEGIGRFDLMTYTTGSSAQLNLVGNGGGFMNLWMDGSISAYDIDATHDISAAGGMTVGTDGAWTAITMRGGNRWMLNAHNGNNFNIRRWDGADWDQHVLQLTPSGNVNIWGNFAGTGAIRSTGKVQLKSGIALTTLDNYHSGCASCPVGTPEATCLFRVWYCSSACHRYCNQYHGYSGGTIAEHNSGASPYADCVCIP
jgi:hypothetical protein